MDWRNLPKNLFLCLACLASPLCHAAPCAAVQDVGDTAPGCCYISLGGGLESRGGTLSQAGILDSVSIYVWALSGTARVDAALYSDSAGMPGLLLAQSQPLTPTPLAWNVFPMPATRLSAGNYWIAFQPDSGGTVDVLEDGVGSPGTDWNAANPGAFGTFPAAWPSGSPGPYPWDAYASVCALTPTPTPPPYRAGVYPDPFTPGLPPDDQARFDLPGGHASGTLEIFGLDRRLVRRIDFPGGQAVEWDGRDQAGGLVLFGVYPYLLRCGAQVRRGTVTVMR